MKTRFPPIKVVALIVLFVAASLGIRVANVIYHYDVIVRGTLGVSVIYLFLRVFWSSKKDPADESYKISNFVRYFIFTFIWGIIIYWALIQALNLIEFLIWK